MCRKLIYLILATLLFGLPGGIARAEPIVAETLLVDLRAEDLPYGPVKSNWDNRGTLADFAPSGTPVVENIDGIKAVTFDGTCWFDGPASTPGIEKAGTRTIEVWAYNPSIPGEETTVSWAHRGGPEGSNMAFNYGNDTRWGAMGHWGGDTHDMGWWGSHSPTPTAGQWWHLAYTYDGTAARVYVNGVQESIRNPITLNTYGGTPIRVAAQANDTGAGVNGALNFTGSIAEVRIHDGVLSPAAILNNFKLGGPKKAYKPSPANGATGVTMPLLTWTAGGTAEWHDVYFGTTPALGPANKVVRSAKLMPMYYHAAGFVPGQTYYWRVDEIEADMTTAYTGDVWSFTAAPLTAYSPTPASGAKFQDTNVDLTWIPGANAASHDVYFGTNEADVAAGTGGTSKGNKFTATYDPGTLAVGTTYYWRIDEILNTGAKQKGEVWSFKTMPVIPVSDPNLVGWWKLDEGIGALAVDWSGQNNHGTVFGGAKWVTGYDGGALKLDGQDDYVQLPIGSVVASLTSATMTTWVNFSNAGGAWQRIFDFGSGATTYIFLCPRTGTTGPMRVAITTSGGTGESLADTSSTLATGWHHVAVSISGSSRRMTLYLDGKVAASAATTVLPSNLGITSNNWLGRSQYAADAYFMGSLDDFRIYNYALSQSEIAETMRGDPLLAWNPKPSDGATVDIEHATEISWSAGDNAAKHDVYVGTDQAAVASATTTTSGIYKGRKDLAATSYSAGFEWGQKYYWRIDEYNKDATTSEGRLWSFTVADYLIVDDFESYTNFSPDRVFQTWIDGLGYNEPAPGNPGNGTGAIVGHDIWTTGTAYTDIAETRIIHGGGQSMPMDYNNVNSPYYSEAERTFASPQNWTRQGVKALTLWFRGILGSVGSFKEGPTGTYTMTASGTDIWDVGPTGGPFHDEFHYAFKKLSGNGSIQLKVESVEQTDGWAKGGVMIRETLDANSPHAMVVISPSNGVALQYRVTRGGASTSVQQTGITAPRWVKLTRNGSTLIAQHSADGVNWVDVGTNAGLSSVSITMNANVYIGVALTSHNAAATCHATFSNITTASATGQWQSQDIGIISNTEEPLYVALEDTSNVKLVVTHPEPNAVQHNTWQEWNIPLKAFSDAGVKLNSVKKMSIGVGDRNFPTKGGAGSLYIDDIRLYQPRCVPSMGKPAADISGDCIVDYLDLEMMADQWLQSIPPATALSADLNADKKVDLKDYAAMAKAWLEEILWP